MKGLHEALLSRATDNDDPGPFPSVSHVSSYSRGMWNCAKLCRLATRGYVRSAVLRQHATMQQNVAMHRGRAPLIMSHVTWLWLASLRHIMVRRSAVRGLARFPTSILRLKHGAVGAQLIFWARRVRWNNQKYTRKTNASVACSHRRRLGLSDFKRLFPGSFGEQT